MNGVPLLNWLLRTSWQASLLVGLVLMAQWLFRRRLNARWRYALWLLVMVRLALPSLPASSWSVFNVVHYAAARTSASVKPPDEVRTAPVPLVRPDAMLEQSFAPSVEGRSPDPGRDASPRRPGAAAGRPYQMKNFVTRPAAFVWLLGFLLLAGRAIGQNLIFMRRLRSARPVTDAVKLALFARCHEDMGVSKLIRLLETDYVKSPALYGFFRPSLLLPANVMGQFSPAEQRHIFLHELAHVKRRDMAMHWVATLFRLVHWFNPVLWFGFQRMAADRELACDELALSSAGEAESRPYGETVLKLLELCARPAVLPGLMGILEEKSQMTRRILMIARYKQQAGWPILALLLLTGLGLVTLTDARTEKPKPEPAAAPRPDLTGEVHLTNGLPAAATVFIATAGPKTGTSMFCPSCYADCVKSAKTDGTGRFKIESLDPTLIFRILVVAKDCKPKYVGSVDPAKGPVKVKLESRNYADSPPGNTLLGRVVDPHGKPIVGAAVESDGIRRQDGSATWGMLKGVDPLAVTDERGEFLITSRDPFWAMDVKVKSRDFARRNFAKLRSGTNRHDLTMTEGAIVSGRVMWQGKPLAGVSVGIVSVNRDPEHYTGHFEVGTDADGRFSFFNLPPNVKYNLYGIMRTLRNHGAIALREIATGDDGSKVDAGDLVVGPGHRLAGRVVLADGKAIPAKTRLLIARESAWDILQITLDADGRFETAEIPSDPVNLSVRIPDYRVSAKNASLDTLNPFQLVGLVNTDITNLVLLLENGPDLQFDYDAPDDDPLSGRPLHGAERGAGTLVGRAQSWRVSGHLIDGKTEKPIQNFQITPGENLYGRINLDRGHGVHGINGVYAVELDKRFVEPVLKAEADGYLPAAVTPPPGDATNFDLRLQPGSGPAGLVLLPNEKPAVNVTVGLVCQGEEGIAILNNKLEGWRAKNRVQTTDAGGHFSFAPESQMECVAAASPDGFKLVSLSELAAHPIMTLEPWGRVKGTLRRPTGPGTNEDLDLEFPAEVVPQRFSLNASEHAITDETGHFEFDKVPPGKLDLTYRVKIGDSGSYKSEPLQTITVIPGQSLELNIDARERIPRDPYSIAPQPKPEQTRGSAITGKIVLPGGKPAAGVKVSLVIPGQYRALGKTVLQTGSGKSLETDTDEAGYFSLPGDQGATDLLVVAEKGFARLKLPSTKETTLTLQPWGEIHGTLRFGRRADSNQWARLRDLEALYETGILDVRMMHPLKVGDFATPIQAKSPTGKKLTLTDYRGKFLLLHFLSASLATSFDSQELKEVFDAYGQDGKLAILSLTYVPTNLLEGLARTNGITWPLATEEIPDDAFAHSFQLAPGARQFSILIDPEGKIASTNLTGAAIKEAVEKALAKR